MKLERLHLEWSYPFHAADASLEGDAACAADAGAFFCNCTALPSDDFDRSTDLKNAKLKRA
jgi:hypothetical protein